MFNAFVCRLKASLINIKLRNFEVTYYLDKTLNNFEKEGQQSQLIH